MKELGLLTATLIGLTDSQSLLQNIPVVKNEVKPKEPTDLDSEYIQAAVNKRKARQDKRLARIK